LLFDVGHWTQDNLTASGPDRLIAPGKNRSDPCLSPGEHPDPPPEDADPATVMVHRLTTEEGANDEAPPSSPSMVTPRTAPPYAASCAGA
jgi:hypothetical protein